MITLIKSHVDDAAVKTATLAYNQAGEHLAKSVDDMRAAAKAGVATEDHTAVIAHRAGLLIDAQRALMHLIMLAEQAQAEDSFDA